MKKNFFVLLFILISLSTAEAMQENKGKAVGAPLRSEQESKFFCTTVHAIRTILESSEVNDKSASVLSFINKNFIYYGDNQHIDTLQALGEELKKSTVTSYENLGQAITKGCHDFKESQLVRMPISQVVALDAALDHNNNSWAKSVFKEAMSDVSKEEKENFNRRKKMVTFDDISVETAVENNSENVFLNGLFSYTTNPNIKTTTSLEKGADCTYSGDRKQKSPLLIAVKKENPTLVQDLLEKDADISQPNQKGKTPLRKALDKGNTKVVEEFLKHGISPNAIVNDKTMLIIAVENFNPEMVKLLLSYNANINPVDKKGRTLLMNVIRKVHASPIFPEWKKEKVVSEEIATLLIQHGADVNCVDKKHLTAMHYACKKRCKDVINVLIDKKVDLNAISRKGETPLSLATNPFKKTTSVVELLKQHGAQEWGYYCFYAEKNESCLFEDCGLCKNFKDTIN